MIKFLRKRLDLKKFKAEYPGDYEYYPWDYEECEDSDCPCLGIHTEDAFRLQKVRDAIASLPWPSYFKGEYSKITKWGFGGIPEVGGEGKYLWINYPNHFSPFYFAQFKVDVSSPGVVELNVLKVGEDGRELFTWEQFTKNTKFYDRVKKWTGLRARVRALERENRKLRRLLAEKAN